MLRRDFMKLCAKTGLLACAAQELPIILGGSTAKAIQIGIPNQPQPAVTTAMDLAIMPALMEMADTNLVNVWAYKPNGQSTPMVPGPVYVVVEGSTVSVTLDNQHTIPHGFAIINGPENTNAKHFSLAQPVPAQGQASFTFTAPPAGTYIYYDDLNAPVNRVMGLHGALVSLPQSLIDGTTRDPYSNGGSRTAPGVIRELFDDLGSEPCFPGEPEHFAASQQGDYWDYTRSWVWLHCSYDPDKNAMVQDAAAVGQTVTPAAFTQDYLPRFFTINGKMGFFLMQDPDISPWGNVGMPALLRSMNVGLNAFSPHIHGNHVYWLTEHGQLRDNLWWVDTWTLEPMGFKDMLNPFMIPPDVTVWPAEPVENGRGIFSQYPMVYPMHCHIEISNTAAGGNYPWGAMLHWTILTGGIGAAELTPGREENPQVAFEPNINLFESA